MNKYVFVTSNARAYERITIFESDMNIDDILMSVCKVIHQYSELVRYIEMDNNTFIHIPKDMVNFFITPLNTWIERNVIDGVDEGIPVINLKNPKL